MDRTTTTHPSYGMLCFNRRHGGDLSLFGSSIKHDNIISMTLKHAEIDRMLNSDWYHGTGTIAEIEMSYAQFAEAISSFGMGDGVPVTIRFTEKEGYVQRPEFVHKKEQFEKEFSKHIDTISDIVVSAKARIAEILNKKTLNKADKDEINSLIAKISREWKDNTPYIYEQFNEQVDKTMIEAKTEIEAFTQYRLDSIAKAALAQKPELILPPTESISEKIEQKGE